MPPKRLIKALSKLWRMDIARATPLVPLSWRFGLPKLPPEQTLHRRLWWHSRYKLPWLFWVPLEALRWGNWQVLQADARVQRAVRANGPRIMALTGIDQNQQHLAISYWAKAWCIEPFLAYEWGLYRPDAKALGKIYPAQNSAFHTLMNRQTGARKADHQLLADKLALTEMLTGLGLRMPDIATCSQGDWQDLEAALNRQSALFCKQRSGSRGEGAFAVWRKNTGLAGQSYERGDLSDTVAVQKAWKTLADAGDILIQPLLRNHPALAPAVKTAAVITLRLVTRQIDQSIVPFWACLQVPEPPLKADEDSGIWPFPVSPQTGVVSRTDTGLWPKQWIVRYEEVWQIVSAQALPFWPQILADSLKAHQAMPRLWAIAWDWVITPDGPVLLEGNSGWGFDEVQNQGRNLASLITTSRIN